MKLLSSLLVALLLLAGASAISASAAIAPSISDSALDSSSPLATTEMAVLGGGAPDWVVGGCLAVGGFLGGRALAKRLVKRAVVGAVCPVCGTAMTIATVACLFI